MIVQFIVNGVVSGSLIAVMAIGFWFICRTTNIFHIAHGAVYTASAYIFYSLYVTKERGRNNFLNYVSQLQATFARSQIPKASK